MQSTVLLTDTTKARFLAYVSPEPNTGCWLWLGCYTTHGYGKMSVAGIEQAAHRISYALFKAQPGPLHIRHKCDTPACVNPDHLELGTPADNTQDSIKRGRKPVGTESKNTHLSNVDVLDIIKSRNSYSALAAQYNLALMTVHKIKTGKTWRHLHTSDVVPFINAPRLRRKLTWDKVEVIRSSTLSHRKLAKLFGVDASIIHDVKTFKTWKKRLPKEC